MNLGCPTCPDQGTLGDAVYDAGMLIALADKSPARAFGRHRKFASSGRPVVPAPVVAQAWRLGARRVYLARALKECAIVCCYTAAEWHQVGELIGQAALPAKKRPDPIDGLVALTAQQIGATAVATSDPDDIQVYLDQLPGTRRIVPVRV
ncbi:type II toxin-antitoxin system VapC family toxin [Streptomyces sp. NPDC000410]|uniref:type II toxin-antitoxin system VapC family toxin n=1 Tax=Streptomyces sp. NPDC000410 TaxID=3154254 RepID=UPI00331ACCD5